MLGLPMKVSFEPVLKPRLSERCFVELSLEPQLIWMQGLSHAAGLLELGPAREQVLELVL